MIAAPTAPRARGSRARHGASPRTSSISLMCTRSPSADGNDCPLPHGIHSPSRRSKSVESAGGHTATTPLPVFRTSPRSSNRAPGWFPPSGRCLEPEDGLHVVHREGAGKTSSSLDAIARDPSRDPTALGRAPRPAPCWSSPA